MTSDKFTGQEIAFLLLNNCGKIRELREWQLKAYGSIQALQNFRALKHRQGRARCWKGSCRSTKARSTPLTPAAMGPLGQVRYISGVNA